MKKTLFFSLILSVFLNFNAYALDFRIFDMRNKIFAESKEIKSLLANSRDVVILTNMFDSCILAMTQIDAYYSMLGIFNQIKREHLTDATLDSLVNWLNETKRTNEVNIRLLSAATQTNESYTPAHIERLKAYFGQLNNYINVELGKFSLLKRSLKIKPPPSK